MSDLRSGRRPGARRRRAPCRRRSTAHRAPGRPSGARSRSTSPAIGRLTGGPWRHGVAVTSIGVAPAHRAASSAQGSSPRALPPSRFAPETVVTTTPADGSSARPAVVEVVVVVVVGEQDGVDRPEVGGGDRGPGQLDRARAPAEVVLPARGVERRIGQQAPAVDLDQRRRPADVGDADVGHALLGTARSVAHDRACSAAHVSA